MTKQQFENIASKIFKCKIIVLNRATEKFTVPIYENYRIILQSTYVNDIVIRPNTILIKLGTIDQQAIQLWRSIKEDYK